VVAGGGGAWGGGGEYESMKFEKWFLPGVSC
jgi:hypothetical protein